MLEVSKVWVLEACGLSVRMSLVPHSPQNFKVSGFSALHFGHLVATFFPSSYWLENIKE
jgi:hypothetical protein